MKVFLDTNVVVDFLAEREDFYDAAAAIMSLAYKGEIALVVSATTFVNAFYLMSKHYPQDMLYAKLTEFAAMCTISDVDHSMIIEALRLQKIDFEDTVQQLSANSESVDIIVTRDKHFKDYERNIMTPVQFLDTYFN